MIAETKGGRVGARDQEEGERAASDGWEQSVWEDEKVLEMMVVVQRCESS